MDAPNTAGRDKMQCKHERSQEAGNMRVGDFRGDLKGHKDAESRP